MTYNNYELLRAIDYLCSDTTIENSKLNQFVRWLRKNPDAHISGFIDEIQNLTSRASTDSLTTHLKTLFRKTTLTAAKADLQELIDACYEHLPKTLPSHKGQTLMTSADVAELIDEQSSPIDSALMKCFGVAGLSPMDLGYLTKFPESLGDGRIEVQSYGKTVWTDTRIVPISLNDEEVNALVERLQSFSSITEPTGADVNRIIHSRTQEWDVSPKALQTTAAVAQIELGDDPTDVAYRQGIKPESLKKRLATYGYEVAD